METVTPDKYPFIAGVAVLALALMVWLVYRNMKDKNEYEESVDDPKRDTDHHPKGDKT